MCTYTANQVSHHLNHFRWQDAITVEKNATQCTSTERDQLITMIVRYALKHPNKPPTSAVNFYAYAQQVSDETARNNLTKRIIQQWPGTCPQDKRVSKDQDLIDTKLLDENLDSSPAQQNNQKADKISVASKRSVPVKRGKNSKRLPPHLRNKAEV